MNSPRYAPAGLLVVHRGHRIMLDGGPGAIPAGRLHAWLVTDERGELRGQLKRIAQEWGLTPHVGEYASKALTIKPHAVIHTAHPAYGYLIQTDSLHVIWAPEFYVFPGWAAGADLMFAEAAGWNRPIRFRGGVGGHACVREVAREAQAHGIKRLVFAHIGRPVLRALDAGEQLPFGEVGKEGKAYMLREHS